MDEVFVMIENAAEKFEFTIKVSMLEIYNERIQDLLDSKKSQLIFRKEEQLEDQADKEAGDIRCRGDGGVRSQR